MTGVISASTCPAAIAASARFWRGHAPLVLPQPRDAAAGGDVLGGLAHGDVHVGQLAALARVVPRRVEAGGLAGAAPGALEDRVHGGLAEQVGALRGLVARDALDPGGHERVPLAGLDRVEGHPRGLHAGGAEPVDRRAGQPVVAEQDRDDAGHVRALLVARLRAPEQEVVELGGVHPRHLRERRGDDGRGQVVGADVDERALPGAADGGAGGGNDDGVGHAGEPSPRVTRR